MKKDRQLINRSPEIAPHPQMKEIFPAKRLMFLLIVPKFTGIAIPAFHIYDSRHAGFWVGASVSRNRLSSSANTL